MCWLYELVHEVYGLRLFRDERASSCEHIVGVLTAVLFVVVVVNVSDDTSSLLLNKDIEGAVFDQETGEPFESSVKVSVA